MSAASVIIKILVLIVLLNIFIKVNEKDIKCNNIACEQIFDYVVPSVTYIGYIGILIVNLLSFIYLIICSKCNLH